MSFSASIFAPNKASALEQIAADQNLPQSVKDFLSAAVNAIADDPVISCYASGHLFTGETGSSDVSNLSISVSPQRSVV